MYEKIILNGHALRLYKWLLANRKEVFVSDKEEIKKILGWSQTRTKRAFEYLSDLKIIKYEQVWDREGRHKCMNIIVKRI